MRSLSVATIAVLACFPADFRAPLFQHFLEKFPCQGGRYGRTSTMDADLVVDSWDTTKSTGRRCLTRARRVFLFVRGRKASFVSTSAGYSKRFPRTKIIWAVHRGFLRHLGKAQQAPNWLVKCWLVLASGDEKSWTKDVKVIQTWKKQQEGHIHKFHASGDNSRFLETSLWRWMGGVSA